MKLTGSNDLKEERTKRNVEFSYSSFFNPKKNSMLPYRSFVLHFCPCPLLIDLSLCQNTNFQMRWQPQAQAHSWRHCIVNKLFLLHSSVFFCYFLSVYFQSIKLFFYVLWLKRALSLTESFCCFFLTVFKCPSKTVNILYYLLLTFFKTYMYYIDFEKELLI